MLCSDIIKLQVMQPDVLGRSVALRQRAMQKVSAGVLRRKSNQASRGNFLQPIFMMQSAEYVLCSYSTI